jgi:hypothetical protein
MTIPGPFVAYGVALWHFIADIGSFYTAPRQNKRTVECVFPLLFPFS